MVNIEILDRVDIHCKAVFNRALKNLDRGRASRVGRTEPSVLVLPGYLVPTQTRAYLDNLAAGERVSELRGYPGQNESPNESSLPPNMLVFQKTSED